MIYKLTNGEMLVCPPKTASSSLTRAYIAAHLPATEEAITRATAYPPGRSAETMQWQGVARRQAPEACAGKVVHLLVRDPLERFLSAVAQVQRPHEVDAVIEELEAGAPEGADARHAAVNPHFRHVAEILHDLVEAGAREVRIYQFPRDLKALAEACDLGWPLPVINATESKPKITGDQAGRVGEIYADDRELFDSIDEAGEAWPGPYLPAPRAEMEKVERLRAQLLERARQRRRVRELAGFDYGGRRLPSDREAQAMISGAYAAARADKGFSTMWQMSPSEFVELDAKALISLGEALRDHVAEAFAEQAATADAIKNAVTLADLEAIEESLGERRAEL